MFELHEVVIYEGTRWQIVACETDANGVRLYRLHSERPGAFFDAFGIAEDRMARPHVKGF